MSTPRIIQFQGDDLLTITVEHPKAWLRISIARLSEEERGALAVAHAGIARLAAEDHEKRILDERAAELAAIEKRRNELLDL